MPAYPPAIVPFFDALAPSSTTACTPQCISPARHWLPSHSFGCTCRSGSCRSSPRRRQRECSIPLSRRLFDPYGGLVAVFLLVSSRNIRKLHERSVVRNAISRRRAAPFSLRGSAFPTNPKWGAGSSHRRGRWIRRHHASPRCRLLLASPSALAIIFQHPPKARDAAPFRVNHRHLCFAFHGPLAGSKYQRHRILERIRRSTFITTKTSLLRQWDSIVVDPQSYPSPNWSFPNSNGFTTGFCRVFRLHIFAQCPSKLALAADLPQLLNASGTANSLVRILFFPLALAPCPCSTCAGSL